MVTYSIKQTTPKAREKNTPSVKLSNREYKIPKGDNERGSTSKCLLYNPIITAINSISISNIIIIDFNIRKSFLIYFTNKGKDI